MKSITSLFVTLVIWFLFYTYETNQGYIISDNILIQRILCWIFFMNAFVLVPFKKEAEIILRFFEAKIFTLKPGAYFFPFLWWWGYALKEEEKNNDNSVKLNFTGTLRHRQIGMFEDLFRDFIIPFIIRKDPWSIFLCLFISFFIGKWSVDYKHSYLDKKSQTQKISKTYNQNVADNVSVNNYDTVIHTSWYPIKENENVGITWNCSDIPNNKYNFSYCYKLGSGYNHIRIAGYFHEDFISGVPYPEVYIDGYNQGTEFYKFFYIKINKLNYKNGMTLSNVKGNLEDFLKAIKMKNFDSNCYRDIEICLKKEFENKVSWLIVDYAREGYKLNMTLY